MVKLPNGYGSITKLSGKRRKPWMVRVSSGWEIDLTAKTKRLNRQVIGYAKTKQEALQMLSEYNQNPYRLDERQATFEEVYVRWEKEHSPTVSKRAADQLDLAFRYFQPIHDRPFRELRVTDLEQCIYALSGKSEMQVKMKSLANQMYKWAIRHDLVQNNYAALCAVQRKEAQIKRIPFSEDEICQLFQHPEIPFSDAVLIGIYTGFRPSELMDIKVENINLNDQTIIGGGKTKAGTNRLVPIHPRILPLIENRLKTAREYLIADPQENLWHIQYDSWKRRFLAVCSFLGTQHLPHDTRHTFATRAKEVAMDEYILKRIMGHAITDVTEAVYTHREIESYHREIQKLT